jgi:hypothetical protein
MIEYPVRCPHGDCKGSKKEFKGFTGIRTHYSLKHGKKILSKDLEEILRMSTEENNKKQEQPVSHQEIRNDPIKQSEGSEVTKTVEDLTSKVVKLTNMIPPNLCEQFPKLCGLPGQIGELKEKMGNVESTMLGRNEGIVTATKALEDIKKQVADVQGKLGKVPTKITVKTSPKQELTKEETKVEEPKKEEKVVEQKPQDNGIAESVEGLTTKIDILLEDMKKVQTSTLTPIPKEEVVEPEKVEKEGVESHKTAKDLLSCPGCRDKLINGMVKEIREKSSVGEVLKTGLSGLLRIGKEVNNTNGEEIKQEEGSADVQPDGGTEDRADGEPKNGGEQKKSEEIPGPRTEKGMETKSEDSEPEIKKPQKCHFFLRR